MILVDVDDRVVRETAADDRQESGGEDLADMAAAHDSSAVGHAQRRAGAAAAAAVSVAGATAAARNGRMLEIMVTPFLYEM